MGRDRTRLSGRSAAATVCVAAVVSVCVACSTSAPRGLPDQRPTIGATTGLNRCPAGTRTPALVTNAVPDARTPATVVVRVGQAVSFPLPAGSRVRVFGSGGQAALCVAGSTGAGSTTLVARQASYVRIAVLGARKSAPKILYVKTTT